MITYKDSGVNIEEGYKSVQLIKKYSASTFIPGVLNGLGSFAGMFELGKYENPVLVSGTDGVGTKLKIAFHKKKYDTVGIDCVAMCVNDILCHGAKPIFFLDYIACGKLDSKISADLVKGVSDGCIQAGCALIGGETAEMPGFYSEGEYDIAGFSVGVVEKEDIIDGSSVKDGDVLIGIASSGVHSNGYSLVRKLIPDLDASFLDRTFADELLVPTKIYVKPVLELVKNFHIKAMAHITGGGFFENIPRMFKDNFTAVVDRKSFEVPEIFKYMISLGVTEEEMYNTYNMGIGFVLCAASQDTDRIISKLSELGEKAFIIGNVEIGDKKVCLK
ncbi:MAG: phosphoribosylformylglycinamidine cyclo-ligase [Clostridium sp.]|jgi:phosphoribosylformylglycinamidine cyclo-ligase|uniref:phosphoribosylformylglycinamidine cyclo-ligase n=1 Tax=Clostridium sp. TaxID=1506 RepID=UPI0025C61170|nr:phosphoribosylformylglycinamidine cyclo-ligase [Clostridium sp.]MCH3964651.1 phosphoribosylformylglycinamidine cyclo-ligase [Clostridium sp.]MCI1715122.1 phosphoribosylformylglycinamidine cyclo-ligase [Clostridium sp.]MCI1799384.1 phosphoribosylformylglycinamidine cyclo-ligase [Clostridium sp.]MCI1813305.1 phosphoribosylformylglycinamidine cyclo-ligase [Clostridium sp.]MCI1870196.1 phosphoribosylformylglycinamidine cyclo-ligase [Clostridium sp.]